MTTPAEYEAPDDEEDIEQAEHLLWLDEYDYWNSLTEQEKEARIKWALR